jgi:hypothetical protein
VALVALLGATACAGSLDRIIRSRASSDLGCPATEIEVRHTGGGGVRARGCGLTATYVCTQRGTTTCVREGGEVVAIGAGERTDDSVYRALEAARPALTACLPGAGALRVRMTIDISGRVTYATPADEASETTERCVEAAFSDVSIDEPAARPRTVTVRVPAGWREGTELTTEAEPSGDAAAEDALRAAIDAQRDSVLACVGTTTVALGLAYATDGSVVVSLRGALSGGDEERCVRAVLRDVRLDPAPSAAGSLIHAISGGT